jgi:hypothetical protein
MDKRVTQTRRMVMMRRKQQLERVVDLQEASQGGILVRIWGRAKKFFTDLFS